MAGRRTIPAPGDRVTSSGVRGVILKVEESPYTDPPYRWLIYVQWWSPK